MVTDRVAEKKNGKTHSLRGVLAVFLILELMALVIVGRMSFYPQVAAAQRLAQTQQQQLGVVYLPQQSIIAMFSRRRIRITVFRYRGRIYVNANSMDDYKRVIQQSVPDNVPLDPHSIFVKWDMPEVDRIFGIPVNPETAYVSFGGTRPLVFHLAQAHM